MVRKKSKASKVEVKDAVVVRFAGDSGDGMQTIGELFSDNSALRGDNITTFPDFPSEIRAPAGSLPGVSGFQVNFGSSRIMTPGDKADVLVAMNPAALKVNLPELQIGGVLIVNEGGFTAANLKKAQYEETPLADPSLAERYELIVLDMKALATEALKDFDMPKASKARCKNFFALGVTYWIYSMPLDVTLEWIDKKWGGSKSELAEANSLALKAGYITGENRDVNLPRYTIQKRAQEDGVYRKISGNEATALGLIAASENCWRDLVLGSYPITPATPVLENLAKHRNFNIKTVQAEDEIAGICVAIGASFAGALGATSTSGPGLCLKSEALGLAVITELPLVVVNVQRGGPSTGLPTKTEQADLLQSMYGRNGEAPVPIVAASSPSDCFDTVYEAARIAVKYRTPVIMLSDTYLANSSEPWRIPEVSELADISVEPIQQDEEYIPYQRDKKTLARRLAIPGRPGFEHRVGGLEKTETGAVSYDGPNHEEMVRLRQEKVNGIANDIPDAPLVGPEKGKLLVISWGSTCGAVTMAVEELLEKSDQVSHIHLRHINPLPRNVAKLITKFDNVVVPEINSGQLSWLLRARFLVDVKSLTRIRGRALQICDLVEELNTYL